MWQLRALALSTVAFALSCSAASNDSPSDGVGGSGASSSGGGGGIGAGGGSGGLIGTGAGTGTGGGGGFAGNTCAEVAQEAKNTVPVDVIWAIDTSCSMSEETAAVKANMNKFSQIISSVGVDVRIVVIAEQWQASPFPGVIPEEGICIDKPLGSGACPGDTNFPKYAHVYETVNSTDALLKYLEQYPSYKNMLRPEAVKIFTVVTDDNSQMPAAEFTTKLNALDPAMIKPTQWKMYGIYCFSDCPSAAKPGTVYAELVKQTSGVSSDMCAQNFNPVFDQLAKGVVGAAKLDCAWAIPAPTGGEKLNPNKVNVIFTPGGGTGSPIGKVGSKAECGPAGGWYYDNDQAPTKVEVCPSTCQTIQSDAAGKIGIQFGCDTIHVPK
ncbi:MAG: hypothetical protein IT377_27440 [Polyangiaceae bacterium]|nr:hypothetical protein [Polyangiaceae bacterium]